MRKRKTLRVDDLKAEVNRRNRESTCSADVRRGWNDILCTILIKANAYNGFCYLTTNQVPPGKLPGQIRNPEGSENTWSFPDTTRVHYY